MSLNPVFSSNENVLIVLEVVPRLVRPLAVPVKFRVVLEQGQIHVLLIILFPSLAKKTKERVFD